MTTHSKIIIGAGIYGLYAALQCGRRGEDVLVLERDPEPFMRATYINQARVHMGYHYPRSISTALKSRGYFDRFVDDFGFCINKEFDKIYATSSSLGWTNAEQFKRFCRNADIPCAEVPADNYFKEGMCDGAFLSTEYTFDAQVLKDWFVSELGKLPNVEIVFGAKIAAIEKDSECYVFTLESGEKYKTGYVLNATYAGVNQIHAMLGFTPLKIKYELCEIILCNVSEKLKDVGLTVMDGPFFSIMPFGKTGFHSLTAVSFVPHVTSYDNVPVFECQSRSDGLCSPKALGNCNTCPAKPKTAWETVSRLARKYMRDDYEFEYVGSLFSMKPILKASEIDDSRPTLVRQYSENPTFISVLSGKINTIYELDEELQYDRQK